MIISDYTPSNTQSVATVKSQIQKMAGVLWDQMLNAMQDTGFGDKDLGTGGSNFESMFNWEISQKDFGKYDSGIVQSALRNMGLQDDDPTTQSQLPEVSIGQTLNSVEPTDPADLFSDFHNAGGEGPQYSTIVSEMSETGEIKDLVDRAISFTQKIWPAVQQAAKELNVPPKAILAQAALETGWGQSVPSNNLFGMKAAPGQASTQRETHEMINGIMEPTTASFRSYSSLQASIKDYVSKIESRFSQAVGQTTVQGFATALHNGGYATDENYVSKIVETSESGLMDQAISAVQAKTNSQTNDTGPKISHAKAMMTGNSQNDVKVGEI